MWSIFTFISYLCVSKSSNVYLQFASKMLHQGFLERKVQKYIKPFKIEICKLIKMCILYVKQIRCLVLPKTPTLLLSGNLKLKLNSKIVLILDDGWNLLC